MPLIHSVSVPLPSAILSDNHLQQPMDDIVHFFKSPHLLSSEVHQQLQAQLVRAAYKTPGLIMDNQGEFVIEYKECYFKISVSSGNNAFEEKTKLPHGHNEEIINVSFSGMLFNSYRVKAICDDCCSVLTTTNEEIKEYVQKLECNSFLLNSAYTYNIFTCLIKAICDTGISSGVHSAPITLDYASREEKRNHTTPVVPDGSVIPSDPPPPTSSANVFSDVQVCAAQQPPLQEDKPYVDDFIRYQRQCQNSNLHWVDFHNYVETVKDQKENLIDSGLLAQKPEEAQQYASETSTMEMFPDAKRELQDESAGSLSTGAERMEDPVSDAYLSGEAGGKNRFIRIGVKSDGYCLFRGVLVVKLQDKSWATRPTQELHQYITNNETLIQNVISSTNTIMMWGDCNNQVSSVVTQLFHRKDFTHKCFSPGHSVIYSPRGVYAKLCPGGNFDNLNENDRHYIETWIYLFTTQYLITQNISANTLDASGGEKPMLSDFPLKHGYLLMVNNNHFDVKLPK